MLRVRTFGAIAVRTGAGERVEPLSGHTKCLALLAYLAAEASDGPVARGRVAALLWSGRTDDRARDALRTTLSRIRQGTDSAVLAGTGTTSVVIRRDHLRVDVIALREALRTGEDARAVELTESYAVAYEHLGMVQLTMGRPEEGLQSIRE